jgi:acetyltransferase
MLGVARVILGQNHSETEFSVVVSEPWQGRGIGAALLLRCLKIAKGRGVQKVSGIVLAENTQMLSLGRKLGFKIRKEQDGPEYELSIDFGKN